MAAQFSKIVLRQLRANTVGATRKSHPKVGRLPLRAGVLVPETSVLNLSSKSSTAPNKTVWTAGWLNLSARPELTQGDPKKHLNPAKSRRARFETGCLLVLLFCLVALPGHAQEAAGSPAPTSSPTDASSKSSDASKDLSENKQDKEARDEIPKRIFWIIPNFMTTNDQPENHGPLTTRQKYSIAWHQFADESAHIGNLLQASISQAANGIPHYGQGWGAFGERFLAMEGDQCTGSFLIYGVLPQFLHQDPRYFRKGVGSPLSRIGYAASRVLIARKDDGRRVFNASQIFGQLGQAGISLTYYPQQDRGVRGLFLGWAVNQAYNIGWNQLKEFTPDLGAYLKRRSQRKRMKELQNVHSDPHSAPSNPAPEGRKS